ncbi:unnamed protein product [Caenorhabditis angaria]|uniref:Uncharacterized protein n=1 Tax=Caenorhabditis angaria TaxID=860376 RepID=A0A9P1J114_9PELO|nr:unnamed protein product [Caenorhabditis angaria]
MPIVRARGTSVRERVAAIEKNDVGSMKTSNSDNTVIRAKYVADVRGVNRYRHFHTPLMNDVNTRNNNYGKDTTSSSSTQLPYLIRPGQIHYIDPDDRDAENGMEKGIRKKKKNVTLPQLNNSTSVYSKLGLKPKKENDIISKIEERAKTAIELKSSSESDNSLKSSYSGVRLNDSLTQKSTGTTPRRTFASLGQRQNGVIITRPVNNSLEVALPPRSKSAQDIEARFEPDYTIVQEPSLNSLLLSSPESRDMATQTANKNVSTASVEFLNCVRSTQTDSVPYVIVPRRKSEAPINLQDIEEREALMEVIEDALGETFDRYSRVRTNQIIANSARKQAQIWRDAKDFLANSLFPHAIQTANKSTSKSKTAAEIVANIKIYP